MAGAKTREGTASTGLLWRWILACAVGEATGLTLSGLVNVLLIPLVADPTMEERSIVLVLRLTMVVAGAIEGLCIGVAQWLVLRRALPAVSGGAWIATTSFGLAVGWLLGTLAASFETTGEPSPATIMLVATRMGACLGAIVGVMQMLVLRAHVERAWTWPIASTAAWSLGMLVTFFAAQLGEQMAQAQAPYTPATLLLGLATGLGVGLVVGAITGKVLQSYANLAVQKKYTDTSV